MACYIFLSLFGISIFSSKLASADNLTIYLADSVSSVFWINSNESLSTVQFSDGSFARLILLNGSGDNLMGHKLGYGCGFFCRLANGASCEFGIILIETTGRIPPHVAWSANRNNLVGENAMLQFSHGGLVLIDSEGKDIWSSDNSNETVVGMSISGRPNLVLFNSSNRTIWQSFDHPTDTLLPGQVLRNDQSLISSLADPNMGNNLFSLSISFGILTAFIHTDNSVPYLFLGKDVSETATSTDLLQYLEFKAGQVVLVFLTGTVTSTFTLAETQWHQPSDFLRLDPDGGLRIYSWMLDGWKVAYDFTYNSDLCQLPLKCGRYGVCKEGQCSCPKALDGSTYFSPFDVQSPELGCHQIGSSSSHDQYQLVSFGDLSYFSYVDSQAAVPDIGELHECREACSRNASCQAAFFAYDYDASVGQCYLPSEVLSIRADKISGSNVVSSAYLKVRVYSDSIPPLSREPLSPRQTATGKNVKHHKYLLFSNICIITIFIPALIFVIVLWKNRALNREQVPLEKEARMPARFSYKEICIATQNFSQEIGRGGFGVIFKGMLNDGTLVAVKQLKNERQGIDDFLTEVRTIGGIHHINLVRLIGFCAEKLHRILVFEYMSNGSLDGWIFDKTKQDLDCKTKLKIIADIAKGLAYLHEECRQRIAHLDVKPHNVLLDDHFHAKISDFGLAKFIDRDRCQFTNTVIRGTLRYLAPEWQHSEHITVKADVYSFGIVVLEILFCRRNLDHSQSHSDVNLITLMRRAAQEDHLIGIIQNQRVETYNYEEELRRRMMRLGVWCTIVDYKKRPSMSQVVKFLEGIVKLEEDISFNLPLNMESFANEEVSLAPEEQGTNDCLPVKDAMPFS
ncbi:S-receptor-like serine/threonine-protein kinase protein [Dioscorea alata]|uniref:S-receptor-like serine/threonine-protein kinase protein n=1 Tax=Dioscorea alata TaxID=55571 RepID=A0ACB7UBT1_DIOAL|nr:S-receptor-like serine/threonine-protein kinase protein [Dioscorea alata]